MILHRILPILLAASILAVGHTHAAKPALGKQPNIILVITDDQGHGTHCAGTIAAIANNSKGIAGVAPNCRIMSLKALGADGSGNTDLTINAITYAVENGAHIISLSLAGGGTSSYETAVNNAYNAGVLLVAAAGNENNDIDDDSYGAYPAKYDNVIAVSSVDHVKEKSQSIYNKK